MNYHLGYMAREKGESSWKMTDLARRMSEDGYIVLSEKESDALKRYEAETNAIKEHIDTLKSEEEKKSVAEAFNKRRIDDYYQCSVCPYCYGTKCLSDVQKSAEYDGQRTMLSNSARHLCLCQTL